MSTVETQATAIDGVEFLPAAIIQDDRGAVLHMLKHDQAMMKGGFGEIYFSEINPGVVKGWKVHHKMTQRICVPSGLVQLVLHDVRKSSVTYGVIMDVVMGRRQNYGILKIPPRIVYGFKNLGECPAILANCTDLIHHPDEQTAFPLDDPRFSGHWR